jgi:hypothetical protein
MPKNVRPAIWAEVKLHLLTTVAWALEGLRGPVQRHLFWIIKHRQVERTACTTLVGVQWCALIFSGSLQAVTVTAPQVQAAVRIFTIALHPAVVQFSIGQPAAVRANTRRWSSGQSGR